MSYRKKSNVKSSALVRSWALIALTALSVSATEAYKLKAFTGRISYRLTYFNTLGEALNKKQLPDKAEVITDGSNWIMKLRTELEGAHIVIYNAAADSIYRCYRIGQALLYTAERVAVDVEAALPASDCSKTEYIGVKAMKCKVKESAIIPELMFASKYANPLGTLAGNYRLLPLDFVVKQGQYRIRFTARSLSNEPIDGGYFFVPDDYLRIDQTELQKLLR
ncbi:MAG: hypothetical protein Kow0075_17050 [Salibacteraceae bacterium]